MWNTFTAANEDWAVRHTHHQRREGTSHLFVRRRGRKGGRALLPQGTCKEALETKSYHVERHWVKGEVNASTRAHPTCALANRPCFVRETFFGSPPPTSCPPAHVAPGATSFTTLTPHTFILTAVDVGCKSASVCRWSPMCVRRFPAARLMAHTSGMQHTAGGHNFPAPQKCHRVMAPESPESPVRKSLPLICSIFQNFEPAPKHFKNAPNKYLIQRTRILLGGWNRSRRTTFSNRTDQMKPLQGPPASFSETRYKSSIVQ